LIFPPFSDFRWLKRKKPRARTIFPQFLIPNPNPNDAVFLGRVCVCGYLFATYPVLYQKFGNMVIFRSGKLYLICSPGNQYYQKIILQKTKILCY